MSAKYKFVRIGHVRVDVSTIRSYRAFEDKSIIISFKDEKLNDLQIMLESTEDAEKVMANLDFDLLKR